MSVSTKGGFYPQRSRLIGWSAGAAFVAIVALVGVLGCGGSGTTVPANRTDWSYHGEGTSPEFWGTMNSAWAVAKDGKEQSPINIDTTKVVADGSLGALVFNYQNNARQLTHPEIINNGHTVQVNLPDGNTLTFGGKAWTLAQFHFHAPSEHEIDGHGSAAEGHLVHQDAGGNLLVVGALYESGAANELIHKVFAAAPAASHRAEGVTPSFTINPMDLLPGEKSYYTYPGSLTTPPCTEGATWVVLQHGTTIGAEDALFMTETFHGSTNRPVQPLHDRTVRSGG